LARDHASASTLSTGAACREASATRFFLKGSGLAYLPPAGSNPRPLQEFISLYGPTLILLENLHDFDTWSWQLLVKAAELLSTDCLILATTRPNDLPAVGSSHHLHGKVSAAPPWLLRGYARMRRRRQQHVLKL
jgi:hypothetical protein